MLEIVVCDDDMADLECAVTMLHSGSIHRKSNIKHSSYR